MPRKAVYPQWVRDQIKSGQSAKKVGDQYYLYETTSINVKGKKNPQPKSKYIGVITPDGIRYSSRKKVDIDDHPEWYEYGLSRCIYDICFKTLRKEFSTDDLTAEVVLNIIKKLSPKSYLLKDRTVTDPKELHVCICNQLKKVEEKNKFKFEDLQILKDIHVLEISGRRIITAVSEEQQKLIESLGVNIYE